MIIEVVAVGTELLLGQIVNSNAGVIGAALADQGWDAHYQQVVGDNLARVEEALALAIQRSDAVIVTGGIGPTRDDLTREAIAGVTGRRLVRNQGYAEELRARFEAMGREFPTSNLRQADYPEGGEQLPNPKGTAPGIAVEHAGTWIFAIPGVPEEMEALLFGEVIPRLRAIAGGDGVLVSRLIRTWGRSESKVGEILDDLYTGSTNPSVAFLASSGEIKIRVTAKAPTNAAAETLIGPVEAEVRRRLGASVFGADGETIEEVLLGALADRAWTIGTAESVTGGLICGRLTSIPGASKVVRGGIVAYQSEVKGRLLGVDAAMLGRGVVTEETALAMAAGARDALGAQVAVAATGSAGPEPQEQPPGTVIIAVVTPEGSGVRALRLPGDRERVRTYAATSALHLARLGVTGTWWRR